VMALKTRSDFYGCDTSINTTRLYPTSHLISNVTGMKVQRNKAIVGQNAFAHEAGIHQHGVLQERTTYEIMKPESVGFVGTNLVLGKHSGRHALRDRVKSLGYSLEEATLQSVFDDFIALADKKKDIYDSDIAALIEDRLGATNEKWTLVSFHTSAGSGATPTATLELQCDGTETFCDAATGDGPIDAIFRAMERILGITTKLEDYQVRSVSSGKDALGEVSVVVNSGGRKFHGKGISTDIIEASARAYLKALNKVVAEKASGRADAPRLETARGV
jgi:2-isopropylmalate synthase